MSSVLRGYNSPSSVYRLMVSIENDLSLWHIVDLRSCQSIRESSRHPECRVEILHRKSRQHDIVPCNLRHNDTNLCSLVLLCLALR